MQVALKIAVEADWLPPDLPHIPMLFPFWGISEVARASAAPKRFDVWEKRGAEDLKLVTLREADVAVLPFDWQFALSDPQARMVAERVSDQAGRAGKLLFVFFFNDSEDAVPLENAIVLRTSLQRGARHNEHAFPPWVDDYVGTVFRGSVPHRPGWDRPTVGFCGFAGYRSMPTAPLSRRLRSTVRTAYHRFPPRTVREEAIRILRRDPRIDTNFLIRDNFFAGVADGTTQQREEARRAFVDNMLASDYVLCARGGGNFSYRYFETLAMGRIPLLIDTNCKLPYDFEIDYSEFGPIVDEKDLETIARDLLAFHDRLSRDDFVDLQIRCRNLWIERLSPFGFFKNIGKHLDLYR